MLAQIESALEALDDAVKAYATLRTQQSKDGESRCVGHLMDKRGSEDPQEGPYGVCAFLRLTANRKSIEKQENVRKLRESCRSRLVEWVVTISRPDHPLDPNDPAAEVSRLTMKAAAVLSAVQVMGGIDREPLEKRLIDNQHTDGSWSFLLHADEFAEHDPIVTALVCRSLKSSPSHLTAAPLRDSLVFLQKSAKATSDPFRKLFILNSIILVSKAQSQPEPPTVKADIGDTINEIYRHHRKSPFNTPNPVIIEFSDPAANRVRQFRLPLDIILLEGLVQISDDGLNFLQEHHGRQLLARLLKCMTTTPFEVDTSSQRISFSTAEYYQDVLKAALLKRPPTRISWYKRIASASTIAWRFGSEFRWKSLFVVATLVAIAVTHLIPYPTVQHIAYAYLFAVLVDLARIVREHLK